ncbi:hypothetical protein BASA50_009374 [Batrachochytrium salamandrivorans]|uniref:Uncharacterized protein n=1 Tax=Batrachochytrium salamandrivorans TaxID=1357716 RepID=A0ABQ8F1J1_9FUNG|nr:hypothetical protein BASA50_009374 [Batrachochytrium salamandrivorans]
MKLISFVAISFLAITVSAKLPWTNPYQNLPTSPSTTTQSEQYSDQDKAEAEITRLTAVYEKERDSVAPIEAKYKIDRQKTIDVGNMMNSIADKSEEPNIKNDEKLELEEEYRKAKMKWDDLTINYNVHYRYYIQIRKGRDNARIALELLVENQKLIRDYNSKHDVKTGPSPNSYYNLVFLRDQIGHIPKEIESLLAEWERIKVDKHLSEDSLRTWKAEIMDRIRRCEKQREIVKVILRKQKHSQPIGVQVREFINSYRRMPE